MDGPTQRSDHAFVVPAYGASPYLAACLASLASQTVSSQLLVATSTPSDFITAAAAAVGAEVRVNPQRRGIAADWNFALRAAPARYVTLAHQDDLYHPDFAACSLRLLERHEAHLCFTGYDEVDDQGAKVSSRISRVKHLLDAAILQGAERPGRRRMRLFLSFGNPLPCSSVTLDLARLGDFAFSDEFDSNLDWEAWLRLLDEGRRFARAPARLVGRRHNPLTETSRLIREGRRQQEDLTMFRRLWPSPLGDAIARLYRASY